MFEYEHEYRLILVENATADEAVRGIALEWDPEKWVDSIRIHPEADEAFVEAVVHVVEQYAPALKGAIQLSAMVGKPPI